MKYVVKRIIFGVISFCLLVTIVFTACYFSIPRFRNWLKGSKSNEVSFEVNAYSTSAVADDVSTEYEWSDTLHEFFNDKNFNIRNFLDAYERGDSTFFYSTYWVPGYNHNLEYLHDEAYFFTGYKVHCDICPLDETKKDINAGGSEDTYLLLEKPCECRNMLAIILDKRNVYVPVDIYVGYNGNAEFYDTVNIKFVALSVWFADEDFYNNKLWGGEYPGLTNHTDLKRALDNGLVSKDNFYCCDLLYTYMSLTDYFTDGFCHSTSATTWDEYGFSFMNRSAPIYASLDSSNRFRLLTGTETMPRFVFDLNIDDYRYTSTMQKDTHTISYKMSVDRNPPQYVSTATDVLYSKFTAYADNIEQYCYNKCSVCGKCLNKSCTEAVCAQKCAFVANDPHFSLMGDSLPPTTYPTYCHYCGVSIATLEEYNSHVCEIFPRYCRNCGVWLESAEAFELHECTPKNPENPDNPDNPDNPENPDNPGNLPENPDNPDDPNNPSAEEFPRPCSFCGVMLNSLEELLTHKCIVTDKPNDNPVGGEDDNTPVVGGNDNNTQGGNSSGGEGGSQSVPTTVTEYKWGFPPKLSNLKNLLEKDFWQALFKGEVDGSGSFILTVIIAILIIVLIPVLIVGIIKFIKALIE